MKKLVVFIGVLVVFIIMGMVLFRSYTKSFSPHQVERIENENLKVEVNYSRPYKKDRIIFGDLVPYGEVWRTGANEPTTFTTNTDLIIKGQILSAGKYSLWTIPGPEMWQVIWNKQIPGWGVDPFNAGKASRNPETDALIIDSPVIASSNTFEQFTIDLDQIRGDIHMVMMWDQTMIVVPMAEASNQ